jgi:hypothetical protein
MSPTDFRRTKPTLPCKHARGAHDIDKVKRCLDVEAQASRSTRAHIGHFSFCRASDSEPERSRPAILCQPLRTYRLSTLGRSPSITLRASVALNSVVGLEQKCSDFLAAGLAPGFALNMTTLSFGTLNAASRRQSAQRRRGLTVRASTRTASNNTLQHRLEAIRAPLRSNACAHVRQLGVSSYDVNLSSGSVQPQACAFRLPGRQLPSETSTTSRPTWRIEMLTQSSCAWRSQRIRR